MMATPVGTVKPSAVRRIWTWWKGVARRIGDFQARILLTVFYFIFVAPFALAVRWGSDPLAIKGGATHGWRTKGDEERAPMERATQQF